MLLVGSVGVPLNSVANRYGTPYQDCMQVTFVAAETYFRAKARTCRLSGTARISLEAKEMLTRLNCIIQVTNERLSCNRLQARV